MAAITWGPITVRDGYGFILKLDAAADAEPHVTIALPVDLRGTRKAEAEFVVQLDTRPCVDIDGLENIPADVEAAIFDAASQLVASRRGENLPIFVDAAGRLLGERPEPPGPDASTKEMITYMRARSAYVDAARACGSRAFARAFCEAMAAEAAAATRPRREAFIIMSASLRRPPSWSWRPVGAKRSRVTGLPSREAAIESLTAAGFTLVDRPEGQ